MKHFKASLACFLAGFLVAAYVPRSTWAENLPDPKTYLPTLAEAEEHKAFYDDPRPVLETFGPKQILPPELYKKLSYDVEQMKDKWSEVVGLKAPDLVGKIAPEIKPGKYIYQDKEKYPGLKELMWPDMYERFNAGSPPHAGNIPEFELIPTRQYYWALPITTATMENMGKTKLADDGYIQWETWIGGYPFPRPSGEFKAQEIIYNMEKRYSAWGGNFHHVGRLNGYTDDLKVDFDSAVDVLQIRLGGRVLAEPYGWFDERARERGELKQLIMGFTAPRDVAGAAESALFLLNPEQQDQVMMYLPSFRRIRKMSATDSQDPIMGQDAIWDDTEGFNQKLSRTRYPYKYELLEEREYLLLAPTLDGSEYLTSVGFELKGLKFERRPMYVVKLTQLDPSYVYSYRILYLDKETFMFYHIDNFDQKGRLYRSGDINYSFFPEMGMFSWCGGYLLMKDHIDQHSGIQLTHQLPAFWTRSDVSLKGIIDKAK